MYFEFFSVATSDPIDSSLSLNQFCDQHRVIDIEKHFVVNGNKSFWSVVKAQVRYMDDVMWWGDSREAVWETLEEIKNHLSEKQLLVKKNIQIQPSKSGVSYCGYRITRGALRLSRRRKRSFQKRRQYWESHYLQGNIDTSQLQQAYSSVEAICAGTDSLAWRKSNLQFHQPLDA